MRKINESKHVLMKIPIKLVKTEKEGEDTNNHYQE